MLFKIDQRPILGLGRALLLPKNLLSEGEVRMLLMGINCFYLKVKTIEEDGVITLPLSKIHYLLALDNLEAEESILRFYVWENMGLGLFVILIRNESLVIGPKWVLFGHDTYFFWGF